MQAEYLHYNFIHYLKKKEKKLFFLVRIKEG